ncbi:BTAD domain-containing putative transcriptional regulator [Alicyclobacillus sp. ALC3]|uniref:BTAD domain-containing putative transcriptional regulator n=1 Tax=Alicyclobacillus sp. ALC3 TaxID=2796143 RepID=UPI002379113E|nr:BTAD domain-containing putative transcriptional regulator [Alicyclobacillus sp. ALC3]WDL98247.1 hypothetical protein JC200_06010 [Alicyclobacillus sp. ALC3]
MSGSRPVGRTLPRARSTHVPRPRITTLLSEVPDFPVTVVKAGAGYGKTTAVANYVQQSELAVEWLMLREEDRYGARFVEQMCELVIPSEVPRSERERILDAGRSPLTWQLSAEWMADVLSTYVHDEEVFVLDDFQVVDEDPPVLQWMDVWLSHLPPNVHIVLVTRTRPALPTLEAESDRGNVLWVRERDLAFTEDEVGFLYNEGPFGDQHRLLDRQQARWLVQRTGGMAMALSMLLRDWRQYGQFARLQAALDQQTSVQSQIGRLFLLDLLPLQRQLLQQTCVFATLEPELCDKVLGRTDSGVLFADLERKGYLTGAEDGSSYQLHPLVREYLAKTLDRQTQEQLAKQAIAWHLERGQESRAIPYLFSLQDDEQMANALFAYIPDYLERGEVSTVQGWLDRLPARVLAEHAGLLVAKAEVYRHINRFAEAMEAFERADELARRQGNQAMRAQVEMGRARLYLDTIQPGPAKTHIRRARRWVAREDREARVSLLQLAFENCINQGRTGRAKRLQSVLVTLPGARLPNNNSDMRLLLRCGAIDEVITRLKPRVRVDAVSGRNALSHREATLLLSLMYAMRGEVAQAKQQALRGHGVGHSLRAPFVSAVGLIRLGHAEHLANPLGDAALSAYQAAADSMDEMEVPRGKSEALLGLCLAHGYRRQLGLARSYALQGISIAQHAGDVWMANLVRAAYGQVCAVNEAFDTAVKEMTSAIDAFASCGDTFLETACRLWRSIAWNHLEDGRWREDFSTVLQSVERHGWTFLLERKTLCGVRDVQALVPLLQKQRPDDAVALSLSTRYLHVLGSEAVEHHPGYTLRVQTLGRFCVWRGFSEIGRRDWQREKARQLFQFLLTHRHTLLHREEICEGLWGDSDPVAAERDFKVALTVLSTAIDPSRPGRGPAAFIVRQGSLYGLTDHPMLEVDRDLFLRVVQDARTEADPLRQMALLAQVVELYQGPYLPEVKYESWCEQERDNLQRQFVQAAMQFSALCFTLQRHADVIDVCRRVLDADPTWEEAYIWLMKTYAMQYNRAMVVQTYRTCERVLDRELGLPPMASTQQEYQALLDTQR